MQQGDIIAISQKGSNKKTIGIAYDSRIIIKCNIFGVKLVSLKLLELSKNYIIKIYRPSIILNHHKRTYFKHLLAGLASGAIPIPLKYKTKFWRFINSIYFHLSKQHVLESANPEKSKLLRIVESSGEDHKNVKVF